MPTLLEQTEITLDWADAELCVHPIPDNPRSSGVHLSQVLRAVAVETGQLVVGTDEDDEMPLRVLLGMGWEVMAARLYPAMWWQPGEMELDGVFLTPDGLSDLNAGGHGAVEGGDGQTEMWCVEEFKYTRKSLRTKGGTAAQWKDVTREWMWMQQVMAYCNAFRATGRECHFARLHVLWACGTYEWKDGGARERYVRYTVSFDESELRANWKMVMANKGKVAGE